MSTCEKCWRDAGGNSDRYHELIKTRVCTPEEQAGPDAGMCTRCGRKTLHQFTGECMAEEQEDMTTIGKCPICGEGLLTGGSCPSAWRHADSWQPSTYVTMHDWLCGCGHWNGPNLATCAQCGRKPGEQT